VNNAVAHSLTLQEPDAELNELSRVVLDAALEVHRALGAGFAECVYEEALAVELALRQVPFVRQAPTALKYKGYIVGEGRLDLIVNGRLIVELKAVEALAPLHFAQTLSYLRASGCRLGLLINFNVPQLRRGVRRVVLSL
jgi:GxxExxY protein